MKENATYQITSVEDEPQYLRNFYFIQTDCVNEEHLSDSAERLVEKYILDPGDNVIHLTTDKGKTRMVLKKSGLLFSILQCRVDCSAILLFCGGKNEKVYVNGQLCGFANDHHILQISLFSGNNILVVETNQVDPAAFLIRLSTDYFEKRAEVSVFYNNFRMSGVSIDVLEKGYQPSERGVYEFYVIPTTKAIDTSQQVRVEIMESLGRMLLDVEYIPFETWGRIDLSKYEYPHDAVNALSVRFLYQTYEHGEWMESRSFSFYPMSEQIAAFARHLELLASRTDLEDNARNCVDYYRVELKQKDFSSPSTVTYVLNMQREMDGIIHNGRRRTYYDRPGVVYLYHRSALDGRIIKIPIRVPVGYRPERKMPLLMHYDLTSYDASCAAIQIDSVLSMNMTGRGFTFGGYTGEATFFEILQTVERYYKIDRHRVFGMGHCGAGVALMNLAMNHPGLFAGLCLSECRVEPYQLQCLSALPLIVLNGEVIRNARSCWDSIEEENGHPIHFFEKRMPNITHDMMLRCYLQRNLLEQLISSTPQRTPPHFFFNSRGNRYRHAYWAQIDRVQSSETGGQIEVLCVSSSKIIIKAVQVIGITLDLPRVFLNRCLDIHLNGTVFRYEKCHRKRLHFTYSDGRWISCQFPVAGSPIYEGLGLLDVYMSPVIVWNSVNGDAVCRLTANAFSSPNTNANQSGIYVRYPVVTSLAEKDAQKHSVVVLDDLSETKDPVLCRIRSALTVRCQRSGFTYQGKAYTGEWCVMQICTNPWNPTMSILHISFSNSKALRSNLFTRKVMLPSLTYRRHPYLNANVLIYYEGTYRTD